MAKQQDDAPIYQRGASGIWWTRFTVAGHETRESLFTRDKRTAQREANRLREETLGRAHRGEERMHWEEAVTAWAEHIGGQVAASTGKRYAVSIKQLAVDFGGMMIHEIGKREITRYIARRKRLATIATVRRDLQALSSLLAFADDQNWRDGNPALDRMRRLKERRDPIILPPQADIDRVVAKAPGNLARMACMSLLTGARQKEVALSEWSHIHGKQMTIIGKGNKRRVIDLTDEALDLLRSVPRHLKSPVIFHHDGLAWNNPATHFAKVTARVAAEAEKAGEQFVRFRFHDLRHVYAVRYLKDGGNIYKLQQILGHTSVKTTEMYLEFLTPDEQRAAKGDTVQNTSQEQRFILDEAVKSK